MESLFACRTHLHTVQYGPNLNRSVANQDVSNDHL